MSSHRLFEAGIKRVGNKDNGFSYVYPDSGERVREEKVLERVESLKIPPAYRDVRVARGPSAKVQAVGYDSAGRLQYVYDPKYREKKNGRSSSACCASRTPCRRCAR
jgi:DNA topoisomerase I